MRYLIIILLFSFHTANAQWTKIVNGQTVPLTQDEITAIQAERTRQDSIANDSSTTRRDRYERQFSNRKDRHDRLMIYMAVRLNDANFATFVTQTRNERTDYPYSPDALITWFTTTYPLRAYYDAVIQERALKILRGQE